MDISQRSVGFRQVGVDFQRFFGGVLGLGIRLGGRHHTVKAEHIVRIRQSGIRQRVARIFFQ